MLGGAKAAAKWARYPTAAGTTDEGASSRTLLDHRYGAGQGRDWHWRASYRCDPVLDPTARQLWLTIATLAWPALEAAPRRGGTLPTLAGPWVFTVALAPSTW